MKIQNSFTRLQYFQWKILLDNNEFKFSTNHFFWFRFQYFKNFLSFLVKHLELQNLIANWIDRISHFVGDSSINKRKKLLLPLSNIKHDLGWNIIYLNNNLFVHYTLILLHFYLHVFVFLNSIYLVLSFFIVYLLLKLNIICVYDLIDFFWLFKFIIFIYDFQ